MKQIFYLLAIFLFLSCSKKKDQNTEANNEEMVTTQMRDLMPQYMEEGKKLETMLHIDEFQGNAIWQYRSNESPNQFYTETLEKASIEVEGNRFIVNNSNPIKYRLEEVTIEKIFKNDSPVKRFLTSYYLDKDETLYRLQFETEGKGWNTEMSPEHFLNIKMVLCNSKFFFLVFGDDLAASYETMAYEGNLYPLPLNWDNHLQLSWKTLSISSYPPLEEKMKKYEGTTNTYGYYVLHKENAFTFYLMVAPKIGGEFDEPCFSLVSIGKDGKFNKLAIPTTRTNLLVDKDLNIKLTYDPIDATSLQSYENYSDSASVFIEKFKVSSDGKIEKVSKKRVLLSEKEISPIEYDQQCISNMNSKIKGLPNVFEQIKEKGFHIGSEDRENNTSVAKAMTSWYKKWFEYIPYSLTFSIEESSIEGLQLLLMNAYQGGDYDNDRGLLVCKGDTIKSYLDLSRGGYHMADYDYKIQPDGMIETGTLVLDPNSETYERIFRVRDRWQIQKNGTIVKK